MGLTRMRVTLRTMMAVVAFLAIGLSLAVWLARREARFRLLRDHHRVLFRQNHFSVGKVGLNTPEAESRRVRAWYHYKMAKKYTTAALHPWLPIEADTSDPAGRRPRRLFIEESQGGGRDAEDCALVEASRVLPGDRRQGGVRPGASWV